MSRFKFWKKSEPDHIAPAAPATVTRFNVTPRQDTGSNHVPSDPVRAERLRKLQRRREAVHHEVEAALEAAAESNRWRAEIALIEQALGEIDADIEALPVSGGPPGEPVEAIPITIESFEQHPVVSLRLAIGSERFLLAEDLDWAERGFQLARSDLYIEEGDLANLTSNGPLVDHLASSLLIFATDVRDRLLEEDPAPSATLRDLAVPSTEYGGWLDWHGNSAFNQERNFILNGMRAEQERLDAERSRLIAEEAKTAESLPFAQRRLAEIDAEIAELIASG